MSAAVPWHFPFSPFRDDTYPLDKDKCRTVMWIFVKSMRRTSSVADQLASPGVGVYVLEPETEASKNDMAMQELS
jgi:hypothetical protein